MLATALSLVLAQVPMATLLVAGGQVPDAMAVRGDAELTPAEAFESARTRAVEQLRERWQQRGMRLAEDQRPLWLPPLFTERAVRSFLASHPLAESMQLLDREDKVRQHEFGTSYQTTLWVAEDPQSVRRAEHQLRRELDRARQRTLLTSGGTVVFWAVLGLCIGWLDRLSRGYMTCRLRGIGLLLGVAVPAFAFLL